VAIIWKQLLDQTVGWINYGITLTVDFLNATLGLSLEDPRIAWLSDPVTALPIIAVVFAWTTVGFNSVIYLAGMQGIPGDLYEAATIDGANRWQRFIHITIPSVSATTFFVIATTTILAFQLFTEVWVLTGGVQPPGGPNNATMTPALYLYNSGFQNFEFGYASAIAWALFGIIFVFTLMQFRRQRAEARGV
jgi:ABC-type sugar transport system permease subunit